MSINLMQQNLNQVKLNSSSSLSWAWPSSVPACLIPFDISLLFMETEIFAAYAGSCLFQDYVLVFSLSLSQAEQ